MADEVLDGAEAVEPVDAPAEGAPGNDPDPNVNDQVDDPIETLAKEMGWNPDFEGEGKRTAREFILKEREIKDNLSRDLRSMRDEVGRISRTSAQLAEDAVKRARAEESAKWERLHLKAVEDGDAEAARRAVTELRKIDQQPTQQFQPAPPSEVEAWVSRNEWFNKDPVAQARAQEWSAKLAHLPVSEQLQQVERAIRKEFPEHFPAPTKQPAGVQTGQARTTAPGNRAKGFNDMPAAAQEMARDFQKRHGIPLEKTAESYWADQAKQRRVA